MKPIQSLLTRIICGTSLLIFAHASFCATIPNTLINTINGFQNPEGLAFTPDGQYLYVCNNGGGGPYVNVVDVATNTVLNTPGLSLGTPYAPSFAAYVAITPDGKYAYVTNGGAYWVSLIDIATNTVLPAPGLVGSFFHGPNGIAITPDGKYAYVSNYYIPTVTVIDIASNTVLSTPGLNGPFNGGGLIAITPNGQYAYVTNSGTTTVSVIDINSNTVTDTIAGFNGPFGIAITSDGRYVYVANGNSTTVSIIDTTTNLIVRTIDGFNQPDAIAITPSGQYAYVANSNTTTVSVVDIASNTIIATIDGFSAPGGLAITPDGQLAYVSNYSSTTSTLSVIALPVSAPANLQGAALRNRFLLQAKPINRVTWQAPSLPLPVTYNIYRDAALTDLAATIPATAPLVFYDYVLPGSTHSYYVTGTDGVGVVSPAASVTIMQPR